MLTNEIKKIMIPCNIYKYKYVVNTGQRAYDVHGLCILAQQEW